MTTTTQTLTRRAESFISDRSLRPTTLTEFAIFSTESNTQLCRLSAVDEFSAIGLALTQKSMRYYLRGDLYARRIKASS